MTGRLIFAWWFCLVALGLAWAQSAPQQCNANEIYHQPDIITTPDHFRRFIKATVDWKTLAAPAATAAGSQLFTSHYGFSGDWSGFGEHYGINILGNISGKFLGNFAMPALFHQDEQLAPLGSGSRWQDRLGHVFVHLIIARSANHSRAPEFNVSGIPASALSALLSNAYQPSPQRNVNATAQRFGWNVAGVVAGDAYTEFHCDLGKVIPWFKCRARERPNVLEKEK